MKGRFRTIAPTVAVLLTITSAACVDHAQVDHAPSNRAPLQKAVAATLPLPVELDELESLAEDLFDLTLQARWSSAEKLILPLKEGVARAEASQSIEYRQMEEIIHRLDRAIAAKDVKASELANELTRTVITASSTFTGPVPTEVALLDYHGRALRLSADDPIRAKVVKKDIETTWSQVKRRVIEAGGPTEAEQFDRLVSQSGTTESPAKLITLSTAILDQVDALEDVFITASRTHGGRQK